MCGETLTTAAYGKRLVSGKISYYRSYEYFIFINFNRVTLDLGLYWTMDNGYDFNNNS